jgi:hypothetical protein
MSVEYSMYKEKEIKTQWEENKHLVVLVINVVLIIRVFLFTVCNATISYVGF